MTGAVTVSSLNWERDGNGAIKHPSGTRPVTIVVDVDEMIAHYFGEQVPLLSPGAVQ